MKGRTSPPAPLPRERGVAPLPIISSPCGVTSAGRWDVRVRRTCFDGNLSPFGFFCLMSIIHPCGATHSRMAAAPLLTTSSPCGIMSAGVTISQSLAGTCLIRAVVNHNARTDIGHDNRTFAETCQVFSGVLSCQPYRPLAETPSAGF